MNLTKYQCPACTGPLKFSGKTGLLECEYCGSSYSVEDFDKKQNSEKTSSENEQKNGQTWEDSNLKAYNCKTCGAELICEEISVSISCPYCGNPTILPGSFNQKGMPDYIIPFKYEKKSAIESLKDYYKKKRFLPKVFSQQNHLEEIKGIYVPFWLYDGMVHASISGEGTRSHVTRSSRYETTRTEHYKIFREGNIPFQYVPADASRKMDDALMDSIEPFNFTELKSFTPSYLPGFFAESYDVSSQECEKRMLTRVENTAVQVLRSDVHGYDSVTISSKNTQTDTTKVSYAFLPVWLLTTKYKDKLYQFAMNGQTGRFTGNLPLDKGKYASWFARILFGGTVIISALIFLAVKLLES